MKNELQKKRNKLNFFYVAFLLIIFLFATEIAQRRPSFCGSCHSKSNHYKTWQESTHGKISNDSLGNVVCSDCHVDPGMKGFFKSKLDGVRHLLVYLINLPGEYNVKRIISVTLKNDNCIKCHRGVKNINFLAEDDLPPLLRDIGLKMDHNTHIKLLGECGECHNDKMTLSDESKKNLLSIFNEEKKLPLHERDLMSCTSCHEDLVHVEPKKYKKIFPTESICEKCHRDNPLCKRSGPIFSVNDEKFCIRCHPTHF